MKTHFHFLCLLALTSHLIYSARVEYQCGEKDEDEFYFQKKNKSFVRRKCAWLNNDDRSDTKVAKACANNKFKSRKGVPSAEKVCPSVCGKCEETTSSGANTISMCLKSDSNGEPLDAGVYCYDYDQFNENDWMAQGTTRGDGCITMSYEKRG